MFGANETAQPISGSSILIGAVLTMWAFGSASAWYSISSGRLKLTFSTGIVSVPICTASLLHLMSLIVATIVEVGKITLWSVLKALAPLQLICMAANVNSCLPTPTELT